MFHGNFPVKPVVSWIKSHISFKVHKAMFCLSWPLVAYCQSHKAAYYGLYAVHEASFSSLPKIVIGVKFVVSCEKAFSFSVWASGAFPHCNL